MRRSIAHATLALSFAFGCQHKMQMPAAEAAIAEIGVQPRSQLSLNGSFEFDILGDVTGQGCYDPRARGFKLGTIPGVGGTHEGVGFNPVRQAQGAAIYEALVKAPGADTILVTWSKVEVQADGSACAEVHGKAIRIRKGETKSGETAAPPPPAPAMPGVPIMPK